MSKTKEKNISYLGIGIAAIVLITAFVIFLLPKKESTQTQNQNSETFIMGKKVFANSCASCHGDNGQGHQDIKEAPALNGSEHSWHHADSQMKNLIRNGGIKMPPVGQDFSGDELDAVISYYKQWWAKDQIAFQEKASRRNP